MQIRKIMESHIDIIPWWKKSASAHATSTKPILMWHMNHDRGCFQVELFLHTVHQMGLLILVISRWHLPVHVPLSVFSTSLMGLFWKLVGYNFFTKSSVVPPDRSFSHLEEEEHTFLLDCVGRTYYLLSLHYMGQVHYLKCHLSQAFLPRQYPCPKPSGPE